MTSKASDRDYHRRRYRQLSRAKITAAIALYAASMPDDEPETNDDDESGAPNLDEVPQRETLIVPQCETVPRRETSRFR